MLKFSIIIPVSKINDYVKGSISGIKKLGYEDFESFYCSPLKVSEYISCGIPVLISGVPEIAELVEKEGYGIAYDELDFEKIKKKLQDFDMSGYCKKAKKFCGDYNHGVLFGELGL